MNKPRCRRRTSDLRQISFTSRWSPWRGLPLLLAVGMGLTGCAPEPPVTRPPVQQTVSLAEVVARVNKNADAMDFLLRAGGVSANGECERDGHREAFQLQGTLLYRKPLDLYLKLEHLGATIEAGSNSKEFWLWEKSESPRYFWGEHEYMDDKIALDADLPLRPDLLIDVLGFGGLPQDTRGAYGPVARLGSLGYELIFMDADDNNRLYIVKTVDVDRTEPCMVQSITYFQPDGRPWLQAKLSSYRRIEGTEILVPGHIRMDWLPNHGWLVLKFDNFKRFDNAAAEKRFQSPRQLGHELGDVNRVDKKGPHGRQTASAPAARTGVDRTRSIPVRNTRGNRKP